MELGLRLGCLSAHKNSGVDSHGCMVYAGSSESIAAMMRRPIQQNNGSICSAFVHSPQLQISFSHSRTAGRASYLRVKKDITISRRSPLNEGYLPRKALKYLALLQLSSAQTWLCQSENERQWGNLALVVANTVGSTSREDRKLRACGQFRLKHYFSNGQDTMTDCERTVLLE
jgi:hypothetical protein